MSWGLNVGSDYSRRGGGGGMLEEVKDVVIFW